MNFYKRKNIVVSSLLLVLLLLAGCTNPTQQINIEKEIYNRARAVDDAPVAINAAYRIVLLDETQTNFYDSIAQIYFEVQNFYGAKTVATNVYKNKQSKQILNILAYSNFYEGNYTDASLYLQDLVKIDSLNSLKYLYDIGICFFNVENGKTAMEYMQKVLNHPASKMTQKEVVMGNQQYKAYYYILALNTVGYIQMLNQQYSKAEETFQQLLSIEPEFELAKNNYKILQQMIAEQG